MEEEFLVFVGVDWGSQAHQVCVVSPSGQTQKTFDHRAEGLAAMVDWIGAQAHVPDKIAVAIETPHGPVVDALLDRGFAVFAINPKQLDRFRDRLSPAGAKDDDRDALVLGLSVKTDRHCFRRVSANDPMVVELREWSRMDEELKEERNRLTNRVRQQLWRYYPQALELGDDPGADWFLDVWALAPTPARARKLRKSTVENLLRAHRIRKIDAEGALAVLKQTAIVVAPGVAEAAIAHIKALSQRLRLVNGQRKETAKKLDTLLAQLAQPEESEPGQTAEQRDAAIVLSCPGIATTVCAALLAEAPQAIRDRDYQTLRALTGVAPVTKRSGKSKAVIMRRACSRRLRNAVYHWARVAVQCDARARASYAALRSRGCSHGRALRSVADRNLARLCAMLKHRTLYDPSRLRAQPA